MATIGLSDLDCGAAGLLDDQIRQPVALLRPGKTVGVAQLQCRHGVGIAFLDQQRMIVAAILIERKIIAIAALADNGCIIGNSRFILIDQRTVRVATLQRTERRLRPDRLFPHWLRHSG
jgi:hypothetical protein